VIVPPIVAGDDVEVGEIRNDLQQRPHIDVLEVERESLALVTLPRALEHPGRVLLYGADLEHEARIALIGVVFPQAARLDDQPRVIALLACSQLATGVASRNVESSSDRAWC
jgi:hypothetical protein